MRWLLRAVLAVGVVSAMTVAARPPWLQCLEPEDAASQIILDAPVCYAGGHHFVTAQPPPFAPAWRVHLDGRQLGWEMAGIVFSTGVAAVLLKRVARSQRSAASYDAGPT